MRGGRLLLLASCCSCAPRRLPAVPWGQAIPACAAVDPAGEWAPEPERVGLFQNAAWLYLRAYKLGMSAGDGDRCGMYPSCSAYTARAVELYGPVLGGWAGAARLTADHGDPALPICLSEGRLLRVDRPEELSWLR